MKVIILLMLTIAICQSSAASGNKPDALLPHPNKTDPQCSYTSSTQLNFFGIAIDFSCSASATTCIVAVALVADCLRNATGRVRAFVNLIENLN